MAALTRTLARTLNRTLARTLTISLTISLTPTLTLTLALIPTLTRTQAAQLTSLVAGYATNGLPLLRLQSPLFYANAAQAPPRPPAPTSATPVRVPHLSGPISRRCPALGQVPRAPRTHPQAPLCPPPPLDGCPPPPS